MWLRLLLLLFVMMSSASIDGRASDAAASDFMDCLEIGAAKQIEACNRVVVEMERTARKPGEKRLLSVLYGARAEGYTRKGQRDRAIADYTRAIRLDPKRARPYQSRGVAYLNQGQYRRAIADFTSGLARDPVIPDPKGRAKPRTYYMRGHAYSKLRRFDEAIADHTQAIALIPDYVDSYYERAVARAAKAQFSRAIADFTRVIELDPAIAGAHQGRGIIHLRALRLRLARADLEQARKLDPKLAIVHQNLGDTYCHLGEEALAKESWQSACRLASKWQARRWQQRLAAAGHFAGKADAVCDARVVDGFRACAEASACFDAGVSGERPISNPPEFVKTVARRRHRPSGRSHPRAESAMTQSRR